MTLLRRLLEPIARRLPFSASMRLAQFLLRAQGIGAGADVATSGEEKVFDLIPTHAPVLFDVGGHVGAYSLAFINRFPNGEVYFFEPSGSHISRAHVALSRNVRFFNVALSDRNGPATLYKDAEVTGLASLTKRDLDHRDIHMDLTETVACRTLDSIVAMENVGHIDLLKIDVEGHELDVLKGALRSLEGGRVSLIQFEFGGCNLDTRTTMRDFFRFFRPLGYSLYLVRPIGGLVPLLRYQEGYEQYQTSNFVAMRTPGTA